METNFETWWTKRFPNEASNLPAINAAFKEIAKEAYCQGFDDGYEDAILVLSGWNE